ncbi:MAG: hypothetical protein JW939_09390 [Candidatus Thermoplasmatota archaeon]|nr:hypothetical protein [Candidatus Thermoplasmatota archaeon]
MSMDRNLPCILFCAAIVSLVFFLNTISADPTETRCAIIIVSDLEGLDQHELDKADMFYQYLLDEGYDEDEIAYLTDSSMSGHDGLPNVTNILSSISWLQTTSTTTSDPVIYVYDHEKMINNVPAFQFSDGDITSCYFDSMLDQTEYQHLTLILNGNHSAMAASDLSDDHRTVICSMDPDRTYEVDQFNIARGLSDPNADLDDNGAVSFSEAYWSEMQRPEVLVQDPVLIG